MRRRKMSMRAMTAIINGNRLLGAGGRTVKETVREIGLGDGLGRCNLQSERYERSRKMHQKAP